MADDVLELTRKCAEVIGVRPYVEFSENDAEAFKLLCWLSGKGQVSIDFLLDGRGEFGFHEYTIYSDGRGRMAPISPCRTPAELRLAIMRAVVKVNQNAR